MFLSSWYRIILLIILFIPAIFCQTFSPVISIYSWEDLSETVYRYLLGAQTASNDQPSKVVILEIDKESEKKFGWPLDRKYLISAIEKLSKEGQPWVISFLHLQNVGYSPIQLQNNIQLADLIKKYGKYIGSGLVVGEWDDDISIDQEEKFLRPNLISKKKKLSDEIPDFGLVFNEDDIFLDGQLAIGMAPRYGTQSVVYCTRLFFHDKSEESQFVIPTSLLWAASYFTSSNIKTSFGASWSRSGFNNDLFFSEKNCLSTPSLNTEKFFQLRQIETIPFHHYIDSSSQYDLRGKLVILANARMKKFQGPGKVASLVGSGVALEHQLNARFLDDILSGKMIYRDPLDRNLVFSWLPIVLAGILFFISFYLSLSLLSLVSFSIWSILLGVGYFYLNMKQIYWIPIQSISYLTLTTLLLLLYWFIVIYFGIKRVQQVGEGLRKSLLDSSTFNQFVEKSHAYLNSQLCQLQSDFKTFRPKMHWVSLNPQAIASSLDDLKKEEVVARNEGGIDLGSAFRVEFKKRSNGLMGKVSYVKFSFYAEGRKGILGYVAMEVAFYDWEKSFIIPILQKIRAEINQQWSRIELLAEQKIKDYELVLNNTRSQIFEKFLAQQIVDRFKDSRTMEENLNEVLVPRKSIVGILQADIRGYSGLFKDSDSIEIVKMLQQYYEKTVDVAQVVAQVKLIGDCIFLFVEEKEQDKMSAADLVLFLASVLIKETALQNEKKIKMNEKPINFGIAIHYGESIVGNLSSSECIDYTVVGPNVNKTARMEELTKKEKIKEIVEENGVLISLEARDALRYFDKSSIRVLNIKDQGLSIRSFEDVECLSYMKLEEVVALGDDPYVRERFDKEKGVE